MSVGTLPGSPTEELADLTSDLRTWLEVQDGLAAETPDGPLPPTRLADEPPRSARSTPTPTPPTPTPAAPPVATPGIVGTGSLTIVRDELGDCTRCGLHEGRSNLVFGVGNENADIVFVGEGPGYHEDQSGEPFVGQAGELLTKIIQGVLRLERSDVYICNVVKCRPPNNRDPEPDEVAACSPFLWQQLDAIQPAVVVGLGRFAVQTLLQTTTSIGRLRGAVHPFRTSALVATYHPAYLLRNPGDKRKVFEDMKLVRQEYAKRIGRELPPILSRKQVDKG